MKTESSVAAALIRSDLIHSPEPYAAVWIAGDAGPHLAVNGRVVETDEQLAAVNTWARSVQAAGKRHALLPASALSATA